MSHCPFLYGLSLILFIFHASSHLQSNGDGAPNAELSLSILQNSCIGLDDGYHYLKLIDQRTLSSSLLSPAFTSFSDKEHHQNKKYPIVRVQCHNEYIILNLHEEPELREYFTSFLQWQTFVSGPSNTHVVNWEQWYLPDDAETSYILSPDCAICEHNHYRQIHGDKSVYMMTGTMFGCFWSFLGEHNFDEDLQSQQCYFNPSYDGQQIHLNEMGELTPFELNDFSSKEDWDHSGVCAFNVRQSNYNIVSQTHDMCTVDFAGENEFDMEMGYHLKPSIGIDGQHCICTKPSRKRYFEVEASELHAAQQRNEEFLIKQKQEQYEHELEETLEQDDIMNVPQDKITYLYQSDFLHGTYRIREKGTYLIMEDIVFDFNAGDVDQDPLDMDSWWPHADQTGIYPGAQEYRDAYFLGFWAGITIETSHVMLDLNGHSLAMSDAFYYQQRWFTTIALQSQYFLPGQGPGFFGATPSFAKHVVIKNGVLGLSSHHNLHGHYNHDITIENIHCRDFETHGIQLNGFDGITLNNIEIGPSSTKVFLRGTFGHARNLLPRLQHIADAMAHDEDENEAKTIRFDGRSDAVSIQQIHDELQLQLEAVFRYVLLNEEPVWDDTMTKHKWQQILETFYNPSGLPMGGGMYGIFLNTVGASVLTYNLQTSTYSNHALLHNIYIHDLQHSMIEFIRMGVPNSGSIYLNALHGCLDARDLLDDIESIGEADYVPRYKGNILADATIAMEYFSNDWDLLQSSLIWHDRVFPWSMGQDIEALNEFNIGCNGDAQVHAAKGLTGIRIDGVNDVQLKEIRIQDMMEVTPPGSTLCGSYRSFDRDCVGKCGGHIRQKEPMQVGFSGHNLQGICLNAATNVKIGVTNIHNLQSLYGLTYGISIWPSVDIVFEETVYISDLLAGVDYHNIYEEEEENNPNRIPEVCGIRVVNEYYSDAANKIYTSRVQFNDGMNANEDVIIANVDGYKTCDVDTSVDDYYDNGQPPLYSMIGVFEGHSPEFVGVGEHGIMHQMIEKKKGNKHWNVDGYWQWILHSFGLALFIATLFVILNIIQILKRKIWLRQASNTGSVSSLYVNLGRVTILSDDVKETTPLLQ